MVDTDSSKIFANNTSLEVNLNENFDFHQLKQYRKLQSTDLNAQMMRNWLNKNPINSFRFNEVISMKIKDGMCLSVLGKAVYDKDTGVIRF